MESDTGEVMNVLCRGKRKSIHRQSAFVPNSGTAGQGEFHEWRKRIPWSWYSEQLWNVPRSQSTLENVEFQRKDSPRSWFAAQYTELDGYLRKLCWKPTCSRRTILSILRESQGIWNHLLANWDQVTRKHHWDLRRIETRTEEFINADSLDLPRNMRPGIFCVTLEELLLKLYDGNAELHFLGISFRKIPRLRWLAMLESQFQDRSVCEYTIHSTHNVVDQWSGDGEINTRFYDVAVNWRAQRLPWFWDAWREERLDEKDHLQ